MVSNNNAHHDLPRKHRESSKRMSDILAMGLSPAHYHVPVLAVSDYVDFRLF